MTSIEYKLNALYEQQQKIVEEIAELRAQCSHPTRSLGNYQWGGPGHICVGHICDACHKYLGDASPEEYAKFKKEEHERNRAWFEKTYPGQEYPIDENGVGKITVGTYFDNSPNPQTTVLASGTTFTTTRTP